MPASIWNPGGTLVPQVDPNSKLKSEVFTATAGQTVFTITGFTYVIGAGALSVYRNGVKQLNYEVTELSTTSFSIAQCEAGDSIEVVGNTSDPTGVTAAGVPSIPSGSLVATTVQAALNELDAEKAALADLIAANVTNTPAGNIAAITVQAAINELDTEKASLAQADLASNTHAATSKVTPVDADEIPLADSAAAFGLKKLTWGNLKAMFVAMFAAKGANSDITSLTGLSGNLSFTGTGNRITGDFSNATIANRVMLQTSTVNGNTQIIAIPNGAGSAAGFVAYNSSDAANASFLQVLSGQDGIAVSLKSDKTGSGTYFPMTFYTGGAERIRIDTSGNTLVTSPAGLGYGTGAGGTVTQATSKSTGVTLNKPTGQITMNNASLASGARVSFIVTNSLISNSDIVILNVSGGSSNPDDYLLRVRVASGAFVISVTNQNASALAEALVINFAVIKGATA